MVNIAQIRIVKPPDVLCAVGLGSCVGVVLYDQLSGIYGMLHVLLPKSLEENRQTERETLQKYANPGLYLLREQLILAGAKRNRLCAKLAGGASVLAGLGGNVQIGQKNGEECLRVLGEMQIPIIGRDLGGSSGRSVYFETETGTMRIKKLAGGESRL